MEKMIKPPPKILLSILFAVVTVGLYWESLGYLPFFDDKNLFQRDTIVEIFRRGFVFELRWLPYFTAAWIDLSFDNNILAQRITSLGIHLVTAYVLYSLIRQVSNHVAPHRNNERAAFAGALLFLLHPLAVYAVGYLIQRSILMATLFGLLSLTTYFDGLVTRKKAYFVFSAFFYLLSAFSKEHAVLIPLAALALTPLVMPVTRRIWRELWVPLSLFVPVTLLVISKSRSVLGSAYEPSAVALMQDAAISQTALWLLSVLTQMFLFFKYLGLMLIPYPDWMSVDMRVPFASSLNDPKYMLGGLAFMVYGLIALRWLFKGGRMSMAGFALLSPWLLFWVELSAVRVQEPFVLYRGYLWLTPLFLLIPAVSYSLSDKVFWTGVLVAALCFSYATHDRLKSFSSEYVVWDDAIRKLPDASVLAVARLYSNRGYANFQRQDIQAAIVDFTRALQFDDQFVHAYRSRSYAYAIAGNYQAAIRDANTLIRLGYEEPGGFNGFVARGIVYLRMRDFTHALEDFDKACKQDSAIGCSILKATQEKLIEDQVLPPR